jgi:hypothetical protein
MDGGDDDVPGRAVAEELFFTDNAVSLAFGRLVETVAAAEPLATPFMAYPVELPAVLRGPNPWEMYIGRTSAYGVRQVQYKAHNSVLYHWPAIVEERSTFTTALPRGLHILIEYPGNYAGHVSIRTSPSGAGDESGEPNGKCTPRMTPEEVVGILALAIQNAGLRGIDYVVSSALSSIGNGVAPTFDGDAGGTNPNNFCYTAFANMLLGRSLTVNDRTYTIVKKHPYAEFTASAGKMKFGEFLSDALVVKLEQSGADAMGAFVDLCVASA